MTEIAKKNKCYIGDLKVAFNMKDNLEKLLPQLRENPKLRLVFDLDAMFTENEGIHIVELK